MRHTLPLVLSPLLVACPTSRTPTSEYCAPDDSVVLTDTDVLNGWGTSLAEHPLMTGSPFVGTLVYDRDGSTTAATITTAYRDVSIVGATNTEDPEYACPPDVSFTMDLTLQTDDGAFDEALEANLNYVWIGEDGTLSPAAVNTAIEGEYAEGFTDDPRGDSYARLDLTHPATEPLPTSGSVSIEFVVPEDEMGIAEGVGELTFP